jgi:hypothetical protein
MTYGGAVNADWLVNCYPERPDIMSEPENPTG